MRPHNSIWSKTDAAGYKRKAIRMMEIRCGEKISGLKNLLNDVQGCRNSYLYHQAEYFFLHLVCSYMYVFLFLITRSSVKKSLLSFLFCKEASIKFTCHLCVARNGCKRFIWNLLSNFITKCIRYVGGFNSQAVIKVGKLYWKA